ncbi:MAG: plasmid stabilization protein [Elusimicrobia bacterium RBG_16_66_12]|nr:MAG: plasmid stabilization protein [Elusimicrobia bacterium RBG_16_66_12]
MRIVWSPLALDRVGEISDYIARESVSAARNWADSIFAKVKRLERFPKSGRAVPEIRRLSIREIIHGDYRVIYRIKREQIAILTVRHGKQELSRRELS